MVAVGVGGRIVGLVLVQPDTGQGAVGGCEVDGAACKQHDV